MLSFLRGLNSFYIYGAGKFARTFYSYLGISEIKQRVKGFIVSNTPEENVIDGLRVSTFEEVRDRLKDETVVIAISESKSKGIREILESEGVINVIQITEEMNGEIEEAFFSHFESEQICRDHVIMWNFWGLGYSDQCKYIAEELHSRNSYLKIFWAITGEGNIDFPDWITPVFIGTEEYYRAMSTSCVLVTNVSAPTGQRFKRKGQYYIYTWHGIGPTKKVEWDSPTIRERDGYDKSLTVDRWGAADLMIAGSDFCHKVYKSAFLYEGRIENWGYPRNDIFFDDKKKEAISESIRSLFGISKEKKIALYAPTFRKELVDSRDMERLKQIYDVDLEKVRKALEKRFGGNFAMLYRFHHFIYRCIDISAYENAGTDVSRYPDMQEILAASDVLITDFSSSMWDFSLMRKPVFLCYNDAQEYEERFNGFYVFPDEYPYYKGHDTDELCDAIGSFDEDTYRKRLDEWFMRFGTYDDGHASERVASHIFNVMRDITSTL